jgi:hypothetical protein
MAKGGVAMTHGTDEQDVQAPPVEKKSQVDQLLAHGEGGERANYVDQVVELYEASERNYRAAMLAGQVVNGFTDSTNY